MTFEEVIRETMHYGNAETRKQYAEENANAPVIMDLDYCDTFKQKLQDFLGEDYDVVGVYFSEDGYSYKDWHYEVCVKDKIIETFIKFIIMPRGIFQMTGMPEMFKVCIKDHQAEILDMIKK